MENLRENCLYQKLELKNQQSKFFDYIYHVHELCGTRLSFKCYVTSMKTIDFPQEYVDTCVEESFTEKDHSRGDNTMLKSMMEQWHNYGHNLYPSVVINDATFRG